MAEHVEAQKSLVAATHQREQARDGISARGSRLAAERVEIARLHAKRKRHAHAPSTREINMQRRCSSRRSRGTEPSEATDKLAKLRQDFQVLQDRLVARREELATMSERLASAEISSDG